MVGLGVLWHLLGAVLSATDLSPAALAGLAVTGVALALLTVALAVHVTRPTAPTRSAVTTANRRQHEPPIVARHSDPDAPGRVRPRAPSVAPAVA